MEGERIELQKEDLILEGVHVDEENKIVAVAYHIKQDSILPRFGELIKEYEAESGTSNNNCEMLVHLGFIDNDWPTFATVLIILNEYKNDWFEGDWLDKEKYEVVELLGSEDEYFYDMADKEFVKEYGKSIDDYLEQFTNFTQLMNMFKH